LRNHLENIGLGARLIKSGGHPIVEATRVSRGNQTESSSYTATTMSSPPIQVSSGILRHLLLPFATGSSLDAAHQMTRDNCSLTSRASKA
jgi:hypothetical protein